MSTLKATFGLNGTMTGQSDPVTIAINDFGIDVDNPSVTSGSGTISAGSKVLIENAAGVGIDYYFYIRNTGTAGGMTGTGKLKITDEHSSSVRQISLLEVGDFMFMPIVGSAADGGVQVLYDTAATNYVYAFFKRV